jgi:peroxiredoxin
MKKLLSIVVLSMLGFAQLRAEFGGIAQVGDKPFAFSGVATDGKAISLDALKGKVVVVYFFSSRRNIGLMELRQIQERVWPVFQSRGLVIVCISRETDASELARATQGMQIQFPLIPDPKQEIFSHYASKGEPRAYLIGKDGTIKLVSLGYTDDEVDRIAFWIGKELDR